MISWVFGPEYTAIDLWFAIVAEVAVVFFVMVLLLGFFSWLYDFNGAMKVYRQTKQSTKGGIK
jgi:hypothetical protein